VSSLARRVSWLLAFLLIAAAGSFAQEDSAREDPGRAGRELGVDARILIGEPAGEPLAGAALESETQEVSSLLRCPVCQGLSVADSPVDSARAMRGEVKELLAMGFTGEQVLDYFELSYGEFVRLEPKAEGFNLLVWIAPIAVLLLGVAIVVWQLRGPPQATEGADAQDPELAALREKVRQEVKS